ncbi:hypothetical protein PR001_g29845 [Phytophthora rubi]|uniref:Uncharacterized protein n=1 Tax=Phytophthora rubi TaxID=129364 RepID=A0A6A3GXY1_9STRA|nr:hypothetical protein PR002_g29775 [Phytophthora rubi]KAE8962034.1 hypothetical protein PR001_g29845 [Phytophthora rubi]
MVIPLRRALMMRLIGRALVTDRAFGLGIDPICLFEVNYAIDPATYKPKNVDPRWLLWVNRIYCGIDPISLFEVNYTIDPVSSLKVNKSLT